MKIKENECRSDVICKNGILKVKCWASLAEVDPNNKYVDNVR